MAEKITMSSDGTLSVPDEPIIPFIEGDGTGVDIWPAAKLVLDAAGKKHGKTIEWKEVLAGEKAFNETGNWLPDDRFWYRVTTPTGSEAFLVDPLKATKAICDLPQCTAEPGGGRGGRSGVGRMRAGQGAAAQAR